MVLSEEYSLGKGGALIVKKKDSHSILDAIFNVGNPETDSLADILPGRADAGKASNKKRKRPWQSGKEECPNCGTLFPSGGICPGCGLHDEEMPWCEGGG